MERGFRVTCRSGNFITARGNIREPARGALRIVLVREATDSVTDNSGGKKRREGNE